MLLSTSTVSAGPGGRGARDPRAWVWLVHGFMGRGENFRSFARRLVERRPELGCLLIDLRMHGASQGFPPPHTVSACVADLRALRDARPGQRPAALLGHSFGGRVALAQLGDSVAPQVWVLDAAPASVGARADSETGRTLAALEGLPPRFADRRAFTGALEAEGVSPAIAAWLAKNLAREADGLRFTLDLGALRALLEDHDRTDCWSLLEQAAATLDVRFVLAGERGSVVDGAARSRLASLAREGMVRVAHIADAGHWVHAERPDALCDLLAAGIP